MKTKDLSEQEAELIGASLMATTFKKKANLKDVHETFTKWFHLKDMNRIDVVLATALSRKLEGKPLWLILVAPSGDMKSEQLNALDDVGSTTKVIQRFTDKTLVNGFKDKEEAPDLAPKLDGKIMLIPDMAEILQLHPNVKAEVWAQLRNLYDGFAGLQTGMGTDVTYRNLRVTFIGASTPAIDEQILIHQSLGTRELIYRPKELVDVQKMMDRVWENERFEEIMKPELKNICQAFLNSHEIERKEIPDNVKRTIMAYSQYLALMRASAPTDSYSGDLRGQVHPEKPTRVLQQLKKFYICLKSLDSSYTDEKALEIILEIVNSSVDVTRQKVFDVLAASSGKLSTSEVSDKLRLGKKTVKTELNILWNLGIVDREVIEAQNYRGDTYVVQENWSLANTELVRNLVTKYIPENISDILNSNERDIEKLSPPLLLNGDGNASTEYTSSPENNQDSNAGWSQCPVCPAKLGYMSGYGCAKCGYERKDLQEEST